jgi:predicted nucleotidyltransferase
MSAQKTKQILDKIASVLDELKARHKVRSISVFGSVARGESTPDSDVDVLVDFESGADLFDLIAVGNLLEDHLGRKVDVVSRKGLRESLIDRIEQEARPI